MNEQINSKRLELLYSHLPISILTGYVAVVFISFVVWNHVVTASFLYWVFIFNLIMFYRIGILLFYKKRFTANSNFLFWDQLNFISTLLTGIIWGTLTLYFSEDWPVEVQVSLWVLLMAMMSGASASFSVVMKYYAAYCVPIFLLSVYTQFISDNYYMFILYSVYMVLLTLTSFNFHKAQNQIINHQFELLQSNIRLEDLATKDSLTDLPNRRAFEDYLKTEWDRHIRSRQVISMMMIDVDYFKDYNDHYGHDKGDKILVEIARGLENSLHRPADKAARYGGEEFIILLPETPKDGALEVAERIHEDLRNKKIMHEYPGRNKYLTVSIGIVTLAPKSGLDLKMLQIMADRELYKAKANGRNCTSFIEDDM